VAAARRPVDLRWLLAGYAGLTGFFALEGLLRQPGSASSLNAADEDRGTTRLIGGAYAAAVELPLLMCRLPVHPLPRAVAPVGLLVQAAGLALRAWSMRSLGRSYSRTLRTDEDGQAPRRLRALPADPSSGLCGVAPDLDRLRRHVTERPRRGPRPRTARGAYRRRITAEEELLRRDLPGYAAYSERTKKLIPFVW
jgi:protein-S-isoprenylcysteine O-methyltransferase Ste14